MLHDIFPLPSRFLRSVAGEFFCYFNPSPSIIGEGFLFIVPCQGKEGDENMEILTWQVRNEKNLTLRQLAELTGLSKSALNNIENSKNPPTLEQLETIAIALNVHITDLFDSEYK